MATNSPQENNSSMEKAYTESPTKMDDSVLAWAKKVGRGKETGSPSSPAREEFPSPHHHDAN